LDNSYLVRKKKKNKKKREKNRCYGTTVKATTVRREGLIAGEI
jgi:hypothetical protein